ncbi:hypothetical protein Q5741_03415 [Paenibacillus sp. JX-17]|uniref:Uncharacterized protein n=1 Tax=Paenibacillus lacisoli TaxID=3064525 RepID=A0ABT9C889_9BACL|nr:hypothetical protein [Paenibacillus sp. JX-17]MDO7905459.1 hypothetical protein [Paenibacillus sp. JX-17]
MDNLVDWIVNHIYIVFVVVFALYSMFSKGVKGATKGGMPTFGGKPESAETQRNSDSSDSDDDWDEDTDESSPYSDSHTAARRPSYNTFEKEYDGEGKTMELDTTLDDRIREMEAERRRIQKHLDSVSTSHMPGVTELSDSSSSSIENDNNIQADDLRRGIVWAEILGPPRAKQSLAASRRTQR